MSVIERVLILILVVSLVAVAVYYGWRQRRTLVLLRPDSQLGPEDRRYLRGQVFRRLMCCLLMFVLAGFLIGWNFLAHDFAQIRPDPNRMPAEGDEVPPEVKESIWFYTIYCIAALLALLGMILLAGLDMIATARYGLRRQRQLHNDQQAMLALEFAKLRRGRDER